MQETSNAANTAIQNFINTRYGADSFDGGAKLQQRLKRIANNAVSKKKRKIDNTVELLAKREETEPHNIALSLLKKDAATVRNFLRKKGVKPVNNYVGMAIQAHNARNADIQRISEQLDIPFDDAELILEHAESQLLNDNNADADEFLGGIAGVVGNVAKKGLATIAEKKQAKGKNGLFAKAVEGLNNSVNKGEKAAEIDAPKGVGGFFSSIFNAVKDDQKKKEIKKMLPAIILGVVALIVITVLITRAAHKK